MSRPSPVGADRDHEADTFDGGEFLLTETRARMQPKGVSIRMDHGEGIVFPSQVLAVASARGIRVPRFVIA